MSMNITLKKNNGITLIELLIGLAITSLAVGGLYRTYTSQQKVFVVQDQVVDIQQNLRGAINRMAKDIRMAGCGNVSMILPATFGANTFNNVINPDTPAVGSLTIVSGGEGATTLIAAAQSGQNQINVSTLTDSWGNPLFDTGNRRYISIGGIEIHVIAAINNASNTITLSDTLIYNQPVGASVFYIRAITYQIGVENGNPALEIDDNTGAGPQPLSDSIESLQFAYYDANNNLLTPPIATPANISMVRVTVTARADKPDPDFKEGDHYRRRQVASYIHLMNLNLGF